ncbi:hypothetical protein MFFC18_45400 [Mariniblastus fucicola]|uniref:Uncharacterized protein n=1 Tax=Mariniblastus fucicola TaxID=980251 RepID=A0A5B9PG93_9BACT|nr:hypothetical protein MFFC18_45400 [Mariniblastus fucicola]
MFEMTLGLHLPSSVWIRHREFNKETIAKREGSVGSQSRLESEFHIFASESEFLDSQSDEEITDVGHLANGCSICV